MKAKDFGDGNWGITCLACGCGHVLNGWVFNGDTERPTFSPSLLVTGYLNEDNPRGVCHSWITNGTISYLADSTHKFAGQSIRLPDFGDYDSPAVFATGEN